MTVALDGSTPARFLDAGTVSPVESWTTASFSPPANTLLVLHLGGNPSGTGQTPTFNTPTNTGTALTWVQHGNSNNASGGGAVVWFAWNTNAQSSITVTGKITWSTATGTANSVAGWLDVQNGAKSDQSTAAFAGSTGVATTSNPSVTTTATGSQVGGVMIDWNASGAPTSSDTIDAYTVATETSGGRALKAANSGAPGSVSVNFVTTGSPINSFVVYEILAASSSSSLDEDGEYIQTVQMW